jgi:DNA repair protein RadD
MIVGTRHALKRIASVLVQAPTGAGKTALASFIIGGTVARGESAWFICHRAELVQQTSLTFSKFSISHTFIASGFPQTNNGLAYVCSIDTLKCRLDKLKPPKVAVIDECHHSGAAGWELVIDWLKSHGTLIIGLSATPQRLDGRGLDKYFDEMVRGPAVDWLIENGFLSPYKLFAPPPPSELKARGKDDGRSSQAKVLDKPKLTGDVVQHWLAKAKGLRTIGFACTRAHSLHMVEAFNAAGIPAAHLDGDTPKGERKRIIAEYAAGRIQVLWNVALFGEGFDLSAIAQTDVTIDCVIINRKTNSLALYLQWVGRALRPYPGKIAIILDHGGNIMAHGYPDDEREWELKGRDSKGGSKKEDGPPPPFTCTQCFNAIKRPLPPACPHCKKPITFQEREIKVADGPLVEHSDDIKRQVRAQARAEQGAAKTLKDLIDLGRKRGHKDPAKWAFNVWSNRRDRGDRATNQNPLEFT